MTYAVCAQPGCPELVRDPTPEKITADSYCDKHRILHELDLIDGSHEDRADPP